MSEEPISLKNEIKRDIYLDFRTILSRLDIYNQYKIPPNAKALKSAFFTFYCSIRTKLETQFNQDKNKYGRYEEMINVMSNLTDYDKLDIKNIINFTFQLSEFLDNIKITNIWD